MERNVSLGSGGMLPAALPPHPHRAGSAKYESARRAMQRRPLARPASRTRQGPRDGHSLLCPPPFEPRPRLQTVASAASGFSLTPSTFKPPIAGGAGSSAPPRRWTHRSNGRASPSPKRSITAGQRPVFGGFGRRGGGPNARRGRPPAAPSWRRWYRRRPTGRAATGQPRSRRGRESFGSAGRSGGRARRASRSPPPPHARDPDPRMRAMKYDSARLTST